MSIYRRAAKVDANQVDIVEALRTAGASVEAIRRPVDLLIGHSGRTMLMEVKNPASERGKREAKAGGNKNQLDFKATWRGGTVVTVDSVEAALRALAVLTFLRS